MLLSLPRLLLTAAHRMQDDPDFRLVCVQKLDSSVLLAPMLTLLSLALDRCCWVSDRRIGFRRNAGQGMMSCLDQLLCSQPQVTLSAG